MPETTNPITRACPPGPAKASAEKSTIRLEGWGEITMMAVAVPLPAAFVAWTVVNQVLAKVGVPVMAPVVVSTDRPGGRSVAPKLVG